MNEQISIEQRPGSVAPAERNFQWPEASAQQVGLDAANLEAAARLAADNASDSLLVIRNGALVLERYWHGKTASDLQQTYSGTKSLFSLLVGRAIARGYVRDLEQSVREIVPEMPTRHSALTFRNVLAMQSGMKNSPEIEALGRTGMTQLGIALDRDIVAEPFQRYYYNNAAYRLLFTALERVSAMTLEELTAGEVFGPLSFEGAYWVRLYAVSDAGEHFTGYQSIRMAPRDFAKSAQVIVAKGMWNGQRFLPAKYVESLIRAPAAEVNPSFGLFHHLNAGSYYRNFAVPDRIERQLVPGAPPDTFLMFSSGGQVVAGVPSLALVIVRTGSNAGSIYEEDNYIARLIAGVCRAAH
ncbi:MAG: serine hydrolase [Pseudomonadales bacterium]|nr:serine hydrolase [Pseudomonadales bacterium]MDP7597878.1 serine hydrolase [Pseudomonadales bacterium]HJN51114.1 serine hydrolase [Pseudomonadales bacterium]